MRGCVCNTHVPNKHSFFQSELLLVIEQPGAQRLLVCSSLQAAPLYSCVSGCPEKTLAMRRAAVRYQESQHVVAAMQAAVLARLEFWLDALTCRHVAPPEVQEQQQISYTCSCTHIASYAQAVIIMCNACDACGYKSSEVKGAGAISPKGRKITVQVQEAADLNRDVIKADSAALKIPEVDLEITSGTLGGLITTVEGLLVTVVEALRKMHSFQLGDSASQVLAWDSACILWCCKGAKGCLHSVCNWTCPGVVAGQQTCNPRVPWIQKRSCSREAFCLPCP